MWSRLELKLEAKDILRKCYLSALFVSFIIWLVIGGGSSNNSRNQMNSDSYTVENILEFKWLLGLIFIALVFVVISVLIKLLIGYNLEVGGRKFFVQATKNDFKVGYLTFGFKSSGYKNIIKVMLFRDIKTFLWGLLFVIPGIIKFYEYRMIPYILADNPQIDLDEAFSYSKKMTDGEKFNMFILDLSFIGWYILGSLLFLVGVVLVLPYVNMTFSLLYMKLLEKVTGPNNRQGQNIDKYDEDDRYAKYEDYE